MALSHAHLLRRFAAAAACALAAGPVAALSLQCAAPSIDIAVEIEPAAGQCAIDGARASLRKPHDPVVCHLANPQLRILTIETNGAFIWEDTTEGALVHGTCRAI